MKKNYLLFLFLLNYTITFGQLGFCNGSSGAPIFFENFGSGTNYGPQLTAGVTNYTYVASGFPNDGQYTLFYRTNIIPNSQNWLYSLDHTPDSQPDGLNGKCLIVNASNTPGQFYRRVVTGLCSNTTFEFTAWLLNIYNSASGGCTGTGIPINVTFEIWNATETVLLQSGSTGNIAGTSTPNWTQYGLVFTMPTGQSAVVLKMKNNGAGGCGNDLAIDDIMFRSCGDYSSITNTTASGNSITICPNETLTNTNLHVTTSGASTYFYQWQQSTDNINFSDILGETNTTFALPTPLVTTYYRVKVAQDISHINNNFCSTLSDIYTVFVSTLPDAPISNGNVTACNNSTTALSVNVSANETVNWYDAATGGSLLLANSTSFTPTNIGTYYAEAINSNGCSSTTRTAVTLEHMPTVTSNGATTICSGETTAITLNSSNTNVTFSWTVVQNNCTGASDGTGNTILQTLTTSGNTTGTAIYTITPSINGCEGISESITINVNPTQIIALSFPNIPLLYCENATAPVLPSTSTNSTPITGTWNPSVINTAVLGTTTYTFTPDIPASCTQIDPYEVTITVANDFMPNFEDTIRFCSGAIPPFLSTTAPNGITGTWNPSIIDNSISNSYTFTPDAGQCAQPQTIQVSVIEATLTDLEYTTTAAFSENQIITVIANEAGNYLYQLDDGPLQESNVFEEVSMGSHSIRVIDTAGCSEELTKEVFIVNYPYFFTPNGDGINDTWSIRFENAFPNAIISIFDRYGKLIKQITNNSNGWDGTFNNQDLPANDYWFTIEFTENNTTRMYKSHFSLIR
ncbi:T9SS type B sorting domain-containing protein [Flavobacterium sp. J27]|uniref:T9SS type B sorting domain-containing protein n=1 Tax=Flavobacterium sp. J27 TaxID=2060419 RepID=UPI0013EEBFB7|nr:T9SS type B sorting domain-containing protein [Flavobacterium sp. J27]